MSGFVALVRSDGAPEGAGGGGDLVRRLTDAMAFRGPDGRHVWAAGPAGLGHALLRTADEPQARQPCTLDGRVWVAADARLDAREDLVRRLGGRCLSDAELILEAYRAWGEGCVERLQGDFAFALWDAPARRLFCARDHLGVKPFYYAPLKDGLLAGNTLACLRRHPAVSARLNEQAVGDFLLFGSNQDLSTTFFADVRRLPPAHALSWSDGALRVRRYWSLPTDQRASREPPRRAADCVLAFREALRTAVHDRLRTGRAGVFMSGGLDSTAVAAAGRGDCDLRAYAIVYDRLIPDQERHYSTLAARGLGIPIDHLAADDYLPFDGWDRWRTPEPINTPLTFCTIDLLKRAAAHGRVVLTGLGGDALLYPHPLHLINLLAGLRWGRWLAEVGGYVLSRGKLPPLGLRTWWRRRRGLDAVLPPLPDWLDEAFVKRAGLRERWEALGPWGRPPRQEEHPTHPVAHEFLRAAYWTSHFEAYDPGVTGVPVEVRHPLFDLRLIDLVFGLPPMPWCVDKDLLRAAMRGLLPEPVRRRPKTVLAVSPLREVLRRSGCPHGLHAGSAVREYVSPDRATASLRRYARPGGGGSSDAVRAFCLDYWLGSLSTSVLHPLSWEEYHAAV